MNPLQELHRQLLRPQSDLWEGEVHLKRNEFLKVKGSTETNIYYVKKGCLRLYLEMDYEEQIIRFGYPGEFITALDSFLSEKPSPFYIQALKKCSLLRMSKKRFMNYIQSDPQLVEAWQRSMEIGIIQSFEREIDLLTTSPINRYHRVLERSPQLFQHIPHKYIANYLRMSPETLSRLKGSPSE